MFRQETDIKTQNVAQLHF